jgi:hypothetical protein
MHRAERRTRQTVFRRRLAVEDAGGDELDEWMVGCPAGETPPIAN